MDIVMLPFLIRIKTVRNSREINTVKTANSVSTGWFEKAVCNTAAMIFFIMFCSFLICCIFSIAGKGGNVVMLELG